MTDRASEETGWHVVAANMVETQRPRRSLWAPEHEPMTWKGYALCTLYAAVAVGLFMFAWAGTP